MKAKSGSAVLPVLMLILGAVAYGLRTALYGVAVDVKGLLLRGHPLEIALAALSAVALILAALAGRKQEPDAESSGNFLAALGNAAAGAGILVTVLTAPSMPAGYLTSAWQILGYTAPVCLLLAAFARAMGKQPLFLLHVAVCLFFLVHIVTRYQLWSANPQMQDYVFALLGAMALMFFGFYNASQEAGLGNQRMKLGMGLAAVYLCLAELARSSCPALYLGGILWVLTDLGSKKKQKEN